MPTIALFRSRFTNEDEVKSKLSSLTKLTIIDDKTLIAEASLKHQVSESKLEQSLFGKTSVFNHYTMEKERCLAYLKDVLADRLAGEECIIDGHSALLVPATISHVLKILVVDTREQRIQRAVSSGISDKEADKLIRRDDQSIIRLADFLYGKDAFDSSLYDMVISADKHTSDEIVQLIRENLVKPALIESSQSAQAAKDFKLSAQVELALLKKGYKVDFEVNEGSVTFLVNKSTLNFTKLANALSSIAGAVDWVKDVAVKKGKNYRASIYRDYQFELPPKVLLVDDEREFAETLSERLVSRNVGSYAVYDGQQAMDFIHGDRPDVMILDLKMPGMDGIEVLRQTKQTNPGIEVIILTGHGNIEDEKTCMELGAFAYLRKPVDIEKLSATIDEAYRKVVAKRQ